jgi:sarcosine oxidase subunit beta
MSVRVALIGAGVTSSLAACRLAARGVDVVVLEQRSIGHGSSSRSAACIRAQWGTPETVKGMRYSKAFYSVFHDELEIPPDERQTVFRKNGYLFLYEDPGAVLPAERADAEREWREAQRRVRMQREFGVEVEVLDGRQVTEGWGHLRTEGVVGATWCHDDGFLIPSEIYQRGFDRSKELGATVRQNHEVVEARRDGGRIGAVLTSGGWIEADWFVNCAGPWAPRVSRRLGGMELSIAPTKRYLWYVAQRGIMPQEAWDRLPMTIYGMRPNHRAYTRPDGVHLMMGCAHETRPETEFSSEDQDAVRPGFGHDDPDGYAWTVLATVGEYFPDVVEKAGLVHTTCGFYDSTPDDNPLIGVDASVANLVHAAGFSGHGIMQAPLTARLIEALVLGEVETDPLGGRCVRLPKPFDGFTVNLGRFAPDRRFSSEERVVL